MKRRDFLRAAAAGTALPLLRPGAVAGSQSQPAGQSPAEPRVRIASDPYPGVAARVALLGLHAIGLTAVASLFHDKTEWIDGRRFHLEKAFYLARDQTDGYKLNPSVGDILWSTGPEMHPAFQQPRWMQPGWARHELRGVDTAFVIGRLEDLAEGPALSLLGDVQMTVSKLDVVALGNSDGKVTVCLGIEGVAHANIAPHLCPRERWQIDRLRSAGLTFNVMPDVGWWRTTLPRQRVARERFLANTPAFNAEWTRARNEASWYNLDAMTLPVILQLGTVEGRRYSPSTRAYIDGSPITPLSARARIGYLRYQPGRAPERII